MANTVFEIKIYDKNVDPVVPVTVEEHLRVFEKALNKYDPDSLLHRLNEEKEIEAPDWMIDLFSYLLEIREITDLGFDFTIGDIIDLWSVGKENIMPPEDEINNILLKERSVVSKQNKITIKNCSIDAGGFGKGFLLEKARDFLDRKGVGNYLLNFGGNVYVSGDRTYKIGIRDPDGAQNEYVKIVSLRDQAISTSAVYERYFEKDGKTYSHIFDPKTGFQPKKYRSVTVICSSPLDSDIYSTAVFVRGKEVVKDKDIEVIIID